MEAESSVSLKTTLLPGNITSLTDTMDERELKQDRDNADKGLPGLYVVSEPSTNDVKNDEEILDIVFVHGLNGHCVKTWSLENSSKLKRLLGQDKSVFWPSDLLPKKTKHARIMTWQYESKVWRNRAKASVTDTAKQLLGDLQTKRELLSSSGPIVFVAHSLGGIIVKQLSTLLQALFEANKIRVETFRDIANSTTGIVFFGTPHRGSDVAKTFAPLHKITSVGWARSFLSDLETHSDELRRISDEFRAVAQMYVIATFYERKIYPGLQNLIVDKPSAVMGIPHEDIMPLDGDHSSMCRFSQNDPRFDKVWMTIRKAATPLAVRGLSPTAAQSV